MHFLRVVVGVILLSLVGCKCGKTYQISLDKHWDSNPRMDVFFSEKQHLIFEDISRAEVFELQDVLIEGTKDEYSKKAQLIKTLNNKQSHRFVLKLLQDKNYHWEETKKTTFKPSLQIIIKGGTEQLTLMYDELTKQMGIIDLEGLKVLLVDEDLHNYLHALL